MSAAKEYAELFPALIIDWRTQFQDNKLPFLFVQLANFLKAEEQPKPSAWAMLRESQLKILALDSTVCPWPLTLVNGMIFILCIKGCR